MQKTQHQQKDFSALKFLLDFFNFFWRDRIFLQKKDHGTIFDSVLKKKTFRGQQCTKNLQV